MKPNCSPPVPRVKTSDGFCLKMALASLKTSTIAGTNSALLPRLPVVCITVLGVWGTPDGMGVMAGGRLSMYPGSCLAMTDVTTREISTVYTLTLATWAAISVSRRRASLDRSRVSLTSMSTRRRFLGRPCNSRTPSSTASIMRFWLLPG